MAGVSCESSGTSDGKVLGHNWGKMGEEAEAAGSTADSRFEEASAGRNTCTLPDNGEAWEGEDSSGGAEDASGGEVMGTTGDAVGGETGGAVDEAALPDGGVGALISTCSRREERRRRGTMTKVAVEVDDSASGSLSERSAGPNTYVSADQQPPVPTLASALASVCI